MVVLPPGGIENGNSTQAFEDRSLMKDGRMSFCAGTFSEEDPTRHSYFAATTFSTHPRMANKLAADIDGIIAHVHALSRHALDANDSSMLARRLP
jgi:hypothetical protein